MMQELMARQGGNQQNPKQQKAQEDAKREADERRQMMLSQILSNEARERLPYILTGFTFKEQETLQQLIGIEQSEFRIKRHTRAIFGA
ncbi:DNA-binding protein DDB_G0278111 isoform X2 [Gossypium hirsutum]|uniref:DNA-binding protein DDB_G0278111 isoform X2 n=1 Tax=Gossypium hirsutum TaxID=3635 RepID=A0ABM3B9Z9_GOSHI|nr:DNA-binding protein DDB_G0278111-like isoform X2 [Gossypium hirsutum]